MSEERELMSQEEFAEYIRAGQFKMFNVVRKFRSARRALRRGHISALGELYPKRPYNNRKPTRGRKFNEDRKCIYGQIKYGRV